MPLNTSAARRCQIVGLRRKPDARLTMWKTVLSGEDSIDDPAASRHSPREGTFALVSWGQRVLMQKVVHGSLSWLIVGSKVVTLLGRASGPV